MPDQPENPLRGQIPTSLPSGRRLFLAATDRGEELSVLSPSGEVEVSIELTDQGPVFRLRGARLQIESTESVAVRCRSFQLRTEEELQLQAGGDLRVGSDREVRVKSGGQTFIDGDFVNLNCLERTGYHDEGVAYSDEESELLAERGHAPSLGSGSAGGGAAASVKQPPGDEGREATDS